MDYINKMLTIFFFLSHRIDLFELVNLWLSFSGMFDSNLDILNVLGPISMKIDMYCWETSFHYIPVFF